MFVREHEALFHQNVNLLLLVEHLRLRIKNMSDQFMRQLNFEIQSQEKLKEAHDKALREQSRRSTRLENDNVVTFFLLLLSFSLLHILFFFCMCTTL